MFGWPYSCAQFIMLVVILNILQARFQKYVNPELPDVQTEFIKGRGMTDKIVNICWIIEKAREFQETSTFASLTTLKPLTWVDHNILWKIVKEMRISDHLTCPLRNLYADQEATVRTRHWTTDWFKFGKVVWQGCILSPCLFNSYAEYIMRNAGLDGSQLESRLLGETSTTSDMQMIPL